MAVSLPTTTTVVADLGTSTFWHSRFGYRYYSNCFLLLRIFSDRLSGFIYCAKQKISILPTYILSRFNNLTLGSIIWHLDSMLWLMIQSFAPWFNNFNYLYCHWIVIFFWKNTYFIKNISWSKASKPLTVQMHFQIKDGMHALDLFSIFLKEEKSGRHPYFFMSNRSKMAM